MNKKILKSLLSLAVLLSIYIPKSVYATDIQEKKQSLLYQYDDPFVNEDIAMLENNGVVLKTKDYYINNLIDENGEILESSVYSKEEYNKLIENRASVYTLRPDEESPVSNSWMKLTLESYTTIGSEYYTFLLHYDWLTSPNFKFHDVIALGHDSNLSFDTTSLRSFHTHYGYGNKSSSFAYTYATAYPENLYAKDYFVGALFKLDTTELYGNDKYKGYISVKGRFTNSNTTSGTLSFLYGHTKLGITLGWDLSTAIKKDGECSLSFSPGATVTHDEFAHQDEFVGE